MGSGSQKADCVKILLQAGAKDCINDKGQKPSQLAGKLNVKQVFEDHTSS